MIYGSFILVWALLGRFIESCIFKQIDDNKVTSVSDIAQMEFVKGFDSYFSVLSKRAKDTWIKEEVICVKRNDMIRLKPESF